MTYASDDVPVYSHPADAVRAAVGSYEVTEADLASATAAIDQLTVGDAAEVFVADRAATLGGLEVPNLRARIERTAAGYVAVGGSHCSETPKV
jgi:hypothetical protein